MGKSLIIGFIIYLLIGLYLINSSFSIISMPNFIQSIDKWIVLIGGLLIIVGGINYLRVSKKDKTGGFEESIPKSF